MTTFELADLLLLVDVCVPVPVILTWTKTQRIAAENWAGAVHLLASDNVLNEFCRAHDEDAEYDPPFACICMPKRPEFLENYPRPTFEQNFPLMHTGAVISDCEAAVERA